MEKLCPVCLEPCTPQGLSWWCPDCQLDFADSQMIVEYCRCAGDIIKKDNGIYECAECGKERYEN